MLTDTEIISSCPPKYNDWTLSESCKRSSTNFIYYGNKVFKNFYCAICHLGDDLEYAYVTPPEDFSLENLFYAAPVVGKSQETGKHLIQFSYESNQCCGLCDGIFGYSCALIDHLNSSWINTITTLKHGPAVEFDFKKTKKFPTSSKIRLDFANVCPQTTFCGPSMLNVPVVAKAVVPPVVLEAILSANTIENDSEKSIGISRVKKTVIKQPSNAHEKFEFCKDKSIFSKASNSRSNKIFLTPNGILVSRCIHICQCVIFMLAKVVFIKIHW